MTRRASKPTTESALDLIDLPTGIRDLLAVIGADALIAVARHYGGVRLYVPKHLDDDHPIAEALGVDAARELRAHYGGETIDVPLLSGFGRALRHAAIRAAWQTDSARAIARRFGTTERHVYRIVNGDSSCDHQLDMFTESSSDQ